MLLSKIYSNADENEGFFETTNDFEIPNSEYLFIDLLTLDYADKC